MRFRMPEVYENWIPILIALLGLVFVIVGVFYNDARQLTGLIFIVMALLMRILDVLLDILERVGGDVNKF